MVFVNWYIVYYGYKQQISFCDENKKPTIVVTQTVLKKMEMGLNSKTLSSFNCRLSFEHLAFH